MAEQPPFSPDPAHLQWEPIDDHLLEEIYNADQAIYPAPLLTYQRMESWAAACPDLSICLRRSNHPGRNHDQAVHGVVIVLPVMKEYWRRLVAGELKEHDIDPSLMFPSAGAAGDITGQSQGVKVGLHVFHIERYSAGGTAPGFTTTALEEVRSRVGDRFPSWEVLGYSALTATPQGNNAFKRLDFSSRFVETKDDDEEAEMLVREGNDAFVS